MQIRESGCCSNERAVGAAATGLAKSIGDIASKSTNAAVRALAGKADEIGDIAGKVGQGTYLANGLTEGTAPAVAKAVIYATPVIGDVFSLAEAIANGDVESGIVATISLIGTAVGAAFPPAGAVIAVGLAIYSVTKMILGWLFNAAEPRDWIADPPGTPQELYESGADVQWETHEIAGKTVALQTVPIADDDLHRGATREAVITVLLDSKWTQENADRQPVKFGFQKFYMYNVWNSPVVAVRAWQGGKLYSLSNCGPRVPDDLNRITDSYFDCGLHQGPTVSLGIPVVVKFFIVYRISFEGQTCSPTPCFPVANRKGSGDFTVLSEGTTAVSLPVPVTYAVVAATPGHERPDFPKDAQEEEEDEE